MSGNPIRFWRVIAGRVRGATHIRLGLPNQDALAFSPRLKPGPPIALAISDGHGSPASFRSALGAQMAVTNAVTILKRPAWSNETAEQIVCVWQAMVQAHLAADPFTDEEWRCLKENGTNRQVGALKENPLLAYGATLLAISITAQNAHFLQLGDGDILTVRDNGEVQRVFPPDERNIANETTSLCMLDAWREARTAALPLDTDQTALYMVSTDGYANSFRDEGAFFQAGRDFLALLRRYGARFIRRRLAGWLNQTSRAGSGDDISLAILYRSDGAEME